MAEHSDWVHVWEQRHQRTVRYAGREVTLDVRRCGCGVQWYRTSAGEEWQESRDGIRRPALPAWKRMEAEREKAEGHRAKMEVVRQQQRQLERSMPRLPVAPAEPLPEIATVDFTVGTRDPKELGVWDDDWWHYEVHDGEILVFHLDPERRGGPVWRFPAEDVPYAGSA